MSSIIKQQSSGLATETQDGLVSTGTQTFGGDKTFSGATIKFDNNVGIGTTTPSYKLHVNGSSYFASNVLCYKGQFSSGDGNFLAGLDGFYGSSYDGYYLMGRPGYSSAFWQHDHGGSVGTIQWATSYNAALYRRNRTDNNTWTAWRQVD